ncbi:NAD-dependent epimerase/dehydratase family protein [Planomonospora sp. ID91781]|uniref:NAD-dependent epimerase/dehydratase family protein n=1 Tax=Planomonospora sp. ID91781 TaxID=2738135 RepID=UPI0018C35E50|nr:NAD-dependent epimerase/dehydratase family protein [Planomonospora sp. ID91781]MBG0822847.1 NAD-dependent epimerase/dehydratase family protein [Planomonospora sp. ID91781]
MDIFVTGASGFIGSALTRTLVARGHRVRGLARSAAAEAKVRTAGGVPVRGGLADLAVLAREAAAGDGVVHTAATTGEDRPAVDAAAVTAMLTAMEGGAFVTTTGAPRARSSRVPVAEDDTAEPTGPLAWLADAEARILDAGHVRGSVVRPPMVYGDGAGPVAGLIAQARRDGVARYVDAGENRWSTVHVGDLALAYARILEGGATGVFHAAEADPVPMADLTAAIGDAAGVPVGSWTLAEALASRGGLAAYLAMDAVLDAGRLRSLGWSPVFGDAVQGICGALCNPAQRYALTP